MLLSAQENALTVCMPVHVKQLCHCCSMIGAHMSIPESMSQADIGCAKVGAQNEGTAKRLELLLDDRERCSDLPLRLLQYLQYCMSMHMIAAVATAADGD